MRYSRLTARDEVAVNAGSSLENVLSNQYRAKARRQIREKIERLLWLIFSLTTIWYGDGKINLVTWLYNRYSAVRLLNSLSGHSQINSIFFNRTWFLLALFAISANGIILMYLIHRHDLHRKGSRWESQASWAVPTSCCLGFVSFVGCVAYWRREFSFSAFAFQVWSCIMAYL